MFRTLSFLLAFLGIAFAVQLVLRQKAPLPTSAPLAEPASAPYPHSIGARGIVESVNENVRISPAVPGLVAKIPVRVGQEVRAGEVLIEQDSRDASALVEVQRANLESLKASLREAEVALADRQDQWGRIEQLRESKVVSVDEKQRTLFALEAAKSRLESRKAEIAAAQALLNKAEVQRELLVVRAPRDGTILQVNLRAGEFASLNPAETPILLGYTRQLQLRADVDEDNAFEVRPQCEATAFIKGKRDQPIPLRFVRIEPYILPKRSLSGESSERVDTRVLQVIFLFDRPEVPVYVGQQMDVFLKGL
jgi:multidrug efflux pump subunit AcrA (membrane-fusion protein)